MTTKEAFTQLSEDNAKLKKGLGEVRTKIDEQLVLIKQLEDGELSTDQAAVVADIRLTAESLDAIVPDAQSE